MGLFLSFGPWTWFVIGGLLLIAEILAPGAFMLWLGMAALVTGAISYLVALPWQWEVLLFAALAVAAVLIGRKVSPRPGEASDKPFLNRRAEGYVGRIFILEAPIEDGVGRVKIDDTVWRVVGPDLPSGTRIKVTAADGAILKVAPAQE